MRVLLYIVILSFSPLICASQKYDYQWPMGYDDNFSNGFGVSILDFNNQDVDINAYLEPDNVWLAESGSFICDSSGQLLLVTNNCGIYDKNLQLIPGTDNLNPGSGSNSSCQQFGYYPGPQMTLILPELSNDSIYYVLHKDNEPSDSLQDFYGKNFYLSVIVRNPDNSFTLKDKLLLASGYFNVSRLTSFINGEGDKWWTWINEYNTNKFVKFEIGGDEVVQGPYVQEIGEPLINFDLDFGQAAFSPNGKMYAVNNDLHKVILYDFDNLTGILSNYRTIDYPDDSELGNGLVFSPDSRFIYASTIHNIYQIDLSDTADVVHIGYSNSTDEHGWPILTGYMYAGPDCRIYVSPGFSTYYLHVIHQPNIKGLACQYEERAIRMPTRIHTSTLNIPIYRPGGACDSTILFLATDVSEERPEKTIIGILPNPASGTAVVTLPGHHGVSEIKVVDVLGRVVKSMAIGGWETEVKLDLSQFMPGVYFLSATEKNILPIKFVIAR